MFLKMWLKMISFLGDFRFFAFPHSRPEQFNFTLVFRWRNSIFFFFNESHCVPVILRSIIIITSKPACNYTSIHVPHTFALKKIHTEKTEKYVSAVFFSFFLVSFFLFRSPVSIDFFSSQLTENELRISYRNRKEWTEE